MSILIMVMLRIGASLLSDSPAASAESGHKHNTHSFTHTDLGGKTGTESDVYTSFLHSGPSYLAVLNRPVLAVGATILQSYVQRFATASCSTNIWKERLWRDRESACVYLCLMVF